MNPVCDRSQSFHFQEDKQLCHYKCHLAINTLLSPVDTLGTFNIHPETQVGIKLKRGDLVKD